MYKKKPEKLKNKSHFTTSSTKHWFRNLSSAPTKDILHKKECSLLFCGNRMYHSIFKNCLNVTLHYGRAFHLEDPKGLPVNGTGNCTCFIH